MDVADVLTDLVAEQDVLDAVVAQLSDDQWALPTPSPRWSVADQIGHLTYFDNNAALAITDAEAFKLTVADLLDASARGDDATDDFTFGPVRRTSPSEILGMWREGRAALSAAAASLTNGTRIEWYGPSMGAKSFLTARLMEVWAHGKDVCDTVSAHREPTRPAPPHRPARIHHTRLDVHESSAGSPRRRRAARADRPFRCRLVVG